MLLATSRLERCMVRVTVDATAATWASLVLWEKFYRGGRVIKRGTWRAPKPLFFSTNLVGPLDPSSSLEYE